MLTAKRRLIQGKEMIRKAFFPVKYEDTHNFFRRWSAKREKGAL
jgi:hypothetical protein